MQPLTIGIHVKTSKAFGALASNTFVSIYLILYGDQMTSYQVTEIVKRC